nr:hypothetical protein [Tanacetum cinerariifolium]
MDHPNITMEEYIRLEEEKARKRRKVFNWETATYSKILYNEDVHDLTYVETEFPTIVFNDTLWLNPRTQPLFVDNLIPSMKGLSRPQSVCTPSKPTEEKKKKRAKLEDFDVNEVSGSVKDLDKCSADGALDKKKKRRLGRSTDRLRP